MMRIDNVVRTVATLALVTAVALPVAAYGQQQAFPPGQPQMVPGGQQQAFPADQQQAFQEGQQAETLQLRVFELKNRDPQQLITIISLVTQADSEAQAALPGQPGVAAGTPRIAGFRGVAGDRILTAASSEEKILFVRGSEDQIKEIEKLVNAFDVKDEQLQPHDFGDLRLVPIRGKDPSQVQSTLSQLNLSGQALRVGEMSLVVFRMDDGRDEQRKQAEEVVKKLDTRAEDGNNEDKDNGNGDQKD